jgi:hypothetical protein
VCEDADTWQAHYDTLLAQVTTLEVHRKRMADISDEIIAAGRAAVLAEQFRQGSLRAQPPSLIEQRDVTRHRRR